MSYSYRNDTKQEQVAHTIHGTHSQRMVRCGARHVNSKGDLPPPTPDTDTQRTSHSLEKNLVVVRRGDAACDMAQP